MARLRETTPRPGDTSGPGLDVFSAAVYTIGALFIIIPVFDLLLNLWPLSPRDLGWRYGALGLFANFLHTPLLGALIVTLFAAAVHHRRVLFGSGLLWITGAALLLIAFITFGLDALQLRSTVLPESRLIYQTSVARAAAKHLTAALAFALLGRAALKAARAGRPARAGTPATKRMRTPIAAPAGTASGTAAPAGTAAPVGTGDPGAQS